MPVTANFDDFIMVSSPELAASAEACMGLLLQVMGWAYDTTGHKAFSKEISALGVLFQLARTGEGCLVLDNTEKRKQEVACLVHDTLHLGQLSEKEAQSLRGRLAFAYFGRIATDFLAFQWDPFQARAE